MSISGRQRFIFFLENGYTLKSVQVMLTTPDYDWERYGFWVNEGPGHNSFTTNEERNDIIVYHARTEAEIVGNPLYNPNRHAMLMKIQWSEDGRPVFDYRA